MTELFSKKFWIHTVSEANQREHWAKKHKRKKQQQRDLMMQWGRKRSFKPPLKVAFVRYSCRTLDKDNLAGAFKHIQDAVAKIIGIDDGDGRVEWDYSQERIPTREHYIEVRIYGSEDQGLDT